MVTAPVVLTIKGYTVPATPLITNEGAAPWPANVRLPAPMIDVAYGVLVGRLVLAATMLLWIVFAPVVLMFPPFSDTIEVPIGPERMPPNGVSVLLPEIE